MRSWPLAGWLGAVFLLRLGYGLCWDFWTEDERQVYLIGLKYFTTGEWPYFGPDVVYTRTQVPGGLLGALIAWPFHVSAVPEAPFVLLNLLSLASLSVLAWYIGRRLPDVPRWALWWLVFFSPWTLNFSTHVVNPSYALTGAICLFVGVFELLPGLRAALVPRPLALAMTGFGLLWVAQLHMSWPLLLPFAVAGLGASALHGWREGLRALGWFSAGAALAGSTLIPTILRYGPGAGGVAANVSFEPANLLQLPVIVARYFSFASFELPRFLGPNTATRVEFLQSHLWAAPFAVFAGIVGLVQPFVLLVGLFWRRGRPADWVAVKVMTVATLVLIYLSFVFSVKDPASHAFYVTLPVVMIYAAYCWGPLLRERRWQLAAAALMVAGSVTHLAIAVDGFHRRSLYRDRPLLVRALDDRDYRLLGERRPVLWDLERTGP